MIVSCWLQGSASWGNTHWKQLCHVFISKHMLTADSAVTSDQLDARSGEILSGGSRPIVRCCRGSAWSSRKLPWRGRSGISSLRCALCALCKACIRSTCFSWCLKQVDKGESFTFCFPSGIHLVSSLFQNSCRFGLLALHHCRCRSSLITCTASTLISHTT